MSDSFKSIQDYIMYQDQWSKSTIGTLNVTNFEEINGFLDSLPKEQYNEVLDFCNHQLQKNKNSVYALYIAGILEIQANTLNDALLIRLLDIVSEHHKWSIVEFIAQKILKYRNNLQALKYLGMVYEASDRHHELIPIWEQIVKIDFDEADMLMKLAQHKRDNGDLEGCIKDYKKAIQRYLHQKNFAQIRVIWDVIIQNNEEYDFCITFAQKVERILSVAKAEELLESLYGKIKKTEDYDVHLKILKQLIRMAPDNAEYREYLVDTYRKKHKDNPQLEDFIRMSNLTQSWRNVYEAISDFEKHISFFPNSFVYHNKWGIGKIQETTHLYLIIDFAAKRTHRMEISMAVTSLVVLPKNHFWVLKSIMSKEKLKTQVFEKPLWTLKKIITSLESADIKTIKNELVPSILTATEWNAWSVKARKILQENPHFGSQHDKVDHFVFSDAPINPIEKFYGIFKMEINFLSKVKLMRNALLSDIFADIQSNEDIFLTILEYFNSNVNDVANQDARNEQFVHSLFVCNEIVKYVPSSEYHIHIDLDVFISNLSLEGAKNVIKTLRINDYKDDFFRKIKQSRTDWRDLYLSIMPYYHTTDIVSLLESEHETDVLQSVLLQLQSNLNDYKSAFIWFCLHMNNKQWFKDIISKFKLCTDLLRIAILLNRGIQNKHQVATNKRHFANLEKFLFDSGAIDALIKTEDSNNVAYLYSLINQISDSIPSRILDIRDSILKYHPDFDFKDQFEFENIGSTGFFTLDRSYQEKKTLLKHIHEVEVPANSKEIEKALLFGDLKENTEYKVALERQEVLNIKVAQLKKEIEQARVFDVKNINLSCVGFGTFVELLDHESNTKKEYTILGPWESDPDKNVISYLSPLGQQLYKKKIKEEAKFTLNQVEYKFTITKIDSAKVLS